MKASNLQPAARTKKKPAPRIQPSARRRHPTYHDQIEPGVVIPQHLEAALDDLRLDPVLDWFDDLTIYMDADRVARRIYRAYDEVSHAYGQALAEVQVKMGNSIFNRLEGAGAAVDRRLVLAAYFIGVRCGRMTQPAKGGA